MNQDKIKEIKQFLEDSEKAEIQAIRDRYAVLKDTLLSQFSITPKKMKSPADENPERVNNGSFLEFCSHKMKEKYPTESSFKANFCCLRNIQKTFNLQTVADFIESCDEIYSWIEKSEKSKETRKKYFFICSSIYKMKNAEKEYEKFWKMYSQIRSELNKECKDNKIKPGREKESLKHTLKSLRESKINHESLNLKELLFNLLVFIDHTTRLEYRTLVFKPSANEEEKKKLNYLWVNNDTGKYQIVLNDHKTCAKYGARVFNIDDKKLEKYIDLCQESGVLHVDQFVFRNKKGMVHKPNKFSEYVKKVFLIKVGSPIIMNDLRKIKESGLLLKNKKFLEMSMNERNAYAIEYFGHSLNSAMNYYHRVAEK